MFKKIRILFVMLMAMFLFSQTVFATEIEIKPVQEGENYYPPKADVANSSKYAGLHIMQLGEVQTFTAYGFGWDSDTEQKIPDVEIKEIKWSFDERFLELIETKDNTITLKAIKARTSRLTVTGEVNGELVSKAIFIVIEGK